MPVPTNVTRYKVSLELASMKVLSIKETTAFCSLISQQILTHFRDELLVNNPAEQSHVRRIMGSIQSLLRIIGKIGPNKHLIPFLEIRKLDITVKNNNVIKSIIFRLDSQHFQILGPVGLIKLVNIALDQSFSSMQLQNITPFDEIFLNYCKEQVPKIKNVLLHIALQIPVSTEYLIKSTSELKPIQLDLVIKFNT
jgi:hypothetical protein